MRVIAMVPPAPDRSVRAAREAMFAERARHGLKTVLQHCRQCGYVAEGVSDTREHATAIADRDIARHAAQRHGFTGA